MSKSTSEILVRNTRPEDFEQISALSARVYSNVSRWTPEYLSSHVNIFPEGQFVAVEKETKRVLGMASSLIVMWDEYDMTDTWRDFTDGGLFTNHDPDNGHTLYGAEIMVDPDMQGRGVGSKIYAARRRLVKKMRLWRIRAGARLRGYHRVADEMGAEEYVLEVVRGRLKDPTLSFQLKHGFEVLAVVPDYLHQDPDSRGYAAVIEWLNPDIARLMREYSLQDTRFLSKKALAERKRNLSA